MTKLLLRLWAAMAKWTGGFAEHETPEYDDPQPRLLFDAALFA